VQARARGGSNLRAQSPRRPALTIDDDVQPAGAAGSSSRYEGLNHEAEGLLIEPGIRSTANLRGLNMRSDVHNLEDEDERISGLASCLGGDEWAASHVS